MSQHDVPMTCPACGAEMNHHADKIDYSVEDASYDPAFGGVLEEVAKIVHCGLRQLHAALVGAYAPTFATWE